MQLYPDITDIAAGDKTYTFAAFCLYMAYNCKNDR